MNTFQRCSNQIHAHCIVLLCRLLRFDDVRTRPQRLLTVKTAAIKDIWLMLNANLSMLCMPSKPAKYGIKYGGVVIYLIRIQSLVKSIQKIG